MLGGFGVHYLSGHAVNCGDQQFIFFLDYVRKVSDICGNCSLDYTFHFNFNLRGESVASTHDPHNFSSRLQQNTGIETSSLTQKCVDVKCCYRFGLQRILCRPAAYSSLLLSHEVLSIRALMKIV